MCVLESSYERLQQQQHDSFIISCTQNYSNTFTSLLQFRHQCIYICMYNILGQLSAKTKRFIDRQFKGDKESIVKIGGH